MTTIPATAQVTENGMLTVTVEVPGTIAPGDHKVLLVVDDQNGVRTAETELTQWPHHDVGPWPESLTLRREEMYGDFGR